MLVDNFHLKIKTTKFGGSKLIITLINMKHIINAPFQMNKTPKQTHLRFFFYPEKKLVDGLKESV